MDDLSEPAKALYDTVQCEANQVRPMVELKVLFVELNSEA